MTHDGLPYTNNATTAQIVERLRRATRVAVVTHRKADGDALGSTLALVRTLLHLGKDAYAVFPGPWIDIFDPLLRDTPRVHVPEGSDPVAMLASREPDALVMVDTGSRQQMGATLPWIEAHADRTIIIDHHASGDADLASLRLVEPKAAAAAEMVAAVCVGLLERRSAAELPGDVAEAIYLGIATDTGWFRYSNTRSSTMHLAADLLDAGVDHNLLMRISEQSDPPERVKLLARALTTLRLDHDDQIATIVIRRKDLVELGLETSDSGSLNDRILSVATVRATAVLTEVDDRSCKASLRSKPPATPGEPDVDVNIVAQRFGGGGHKRASGARADIPVDEARERIIATIAEQLR
ncbi:MAG: bifunctional oligoribonuclease/PAP phosphatase NrnA [Phycisphaeraceae bacterium]|nr:bifunctional oligoribonuclease/PAP phosphatase NrnA [Phycisphaeraceae bacterium]